MRRQRRVFCSSVHAWFAALSDGDTGITRNNFLPFTRSQVPFGSVGNDRTKRITDSSRTSTSTSFISSPRDGPSEFGTQYHDTRGYSYLPLLAAPCSGASETLALRRG